MSLLWGNVSTTKGKVYTILFLILSICAYYSLGRSFSLSKFSIRVFPFITFLISLIIYFPIPKLIREYTKSIPINQNLAIVVLFVYLYGTLFLSVAIGIPSILVNHYGKEFSYKGIITKKYTHEGRRIKKNKIKVQNLPSLKKQSITVKKKFWNSIEEGQIVLISGKELSLGKTILSVQLVKDVDYYKTRGEQYYRNGQYEMALSEFNKIIEMNPDNAEAYKSVGDIYYLQKKLDLSLRHYNKAIALNPNYYSAFKNRSLVYFIKREYDNAIADLDQTIELNPRDSDAYTNKGNVFLKKRKYDNAIKQYNEAIEINHWHHGAYRGIGTAYFHKGDYDHAVESYSKSIELNPRFAGAYNDRGYVHAKQGDYTKACADYATGCKFGKCNRLNAAKEKGYCN